MKPLVKKVLLGVGGVLALSAAGLGAFVWSQTSAYASSMEKIYDVPLPGLVASKDPASIQRGEHLAKSVAACATADCHGKDLAGGNALEMGPLGTIVGPNVTSAGLGAAYSDGELARLIQHGIKKDGRSVVFMPAHEINWLPDEDVVAILSYVRSLPGVDKPNGAMKVGLLGKVLDRRDSIVLDVARRIDHSRLDKAPPAAPTVEYGKHIAKLCMGCHGTGFGGGPIPGAPSHIPTPTNITPHESGIKAWSYEDFSTLLDRGLKKDGQPLDPFMPLEALSNMDETERKALWAFLTSLPPREFGTR